MPNEDEGSRPLILLQPKRSFTLVSIAMRLYPDSANALLDYLYLPRNAVIQPFIMSSSETSGPRKKAVVAETGPSASATPQNIPPSTRDSTDIQRPESVVVGTVLAADVEHEPDAELQVIDVIRHTDSGLRGIEIPPEYTAE